MSDYIKFNIKLPVKSVTRSDNYALIIVDFDNVTHYFNDDGSYDGYEHNTNIDGATRVNLN